MGPPWSFAYVGNAAQTLAFSLLSHQFSQPITFETFAKSLRGKDLQNRFTYKLSFNGICYCRMLGGDATRGGECCAVPSV